ncbi:metallophosphoesterase [Niabella ginsenosidivorans]|uniref:Metallophosphoesterase n=1 Tax=Niabella ginsenosidivorans TaxID=1176587 RepID=A0A1A9IA47_9BACT|nr:metallophosphoesterase [Niabella ginsenosidivorans]ANH83424.1 metallophosphoesterase [Niabella ginsenosidivorans]
MRRFLRFLLLKPVLWAAKKFDSDPDKIKVFDALTKLFNRISDHQSKLGLLIDFDLQKDKYIIFSDQHKGARNGADDFRLAAPAYVAALNYYNTSLFSFINLGDCEELWENPLFRVKKFNGEPFEAEKAFVQRDAFIKVIGNHDLYWGNDPLAGLELEAVFGKKIKAYEGVILQTIINGRPLRIFCTHGHQGDANSDGNWFSKFFISKIWGPLQACLQINPNEPSNNDYKKTLHNEIMYEWSSEQDAILLITGHTHQPVFESLTHIERLYRQMEIAKLKSDAVTIERIKEETIAFRKRFDTLLLDYNRILPTYFNSGCCCFSDGDITGIEIEGGFIRLIKWETKGGRPERIVLEETSLGVIMEAVKK